MLANTNGYIRLAAAESAYGGKFDGWVYANGAKIYKCEFPEAYEFFMRSSYPGKQAEGDVEANYTVTIPNICKFIKLNANTSLTPVVDYTASYTTPTHAH